MKKKRKCIILFTDKSKEDFEQLPDEFIDDCLSKLGKLEMDIEFGKKLYNQDGRDLSSCRKIYFANATYRIVYREVEGTCTILEIEEVPKPIAEIVAIGKRDNLAVYETAYDRISNNDDDNSKH